MSGHIISVNQLLDTIYFMLIKLIAVVVTIVQLALSLVSLSYLFLVFLRDSAPDNMPNIHVNTVQQLSLSESLLINAGLVLLFWIQHIVMASQTYKKIMRKLPGYQIFQRNIYNIMSSLGLFAMYYYYRPTGKVLYKLGEGLQPLLILGQIVGAVFFFGSTLEMDEIADVFGIRGTIRLFTNYKPTNQIAVTFFYKLCRHPMQLGIILMLLTSGLVISLDRVLILILMLIGINIGVRMEEGMLLEKKEYVKYSSQVKCRFFPLGGYKQKI